MCVCRCSPRFLLLIHCTCMFRRKKTCVDETETSVSPCAAMIVRRVVMLRRRLPVPWQLATPSRTVCRTYFLDSPPPSPMGVAAAVPQGLGGRLTHACRQPKLDGWRLAGAYSSPVQTGAYSSLRLHKAGAYSSLGRLQNGCCVLVPASS